MAMSSWNTTVESLKEKVNQNKTPTMSMIKDLFDAVSRGDIQHTLRILRHSGNAAEWILDNSVRK
jgi:hypothetical protein